MSILETTSDTFSTYNRSHFQAAWAFEPIERSKKYLGNLYILFDISENLYPLGKMLAPLFESDYYHHNRDAEPLSSFEQTLAIINRKIRGYLQTRLDQKYTCNIVAAVLHDDILHLVQIGEVNVFLLRKGTFKRISNVKSSYNDIPQFQNIATGSLQQGDSLLISNTPFLEMIELKKLKQIVAANSPTTAIAHIKEQISSTPQEHPCHLILVECLGDNEPFATEESDDQTTAKTNSSENTLVEKISPLKKTIVEPMGSFQSDNATKRHSSSSDQLEELGLLGTWKKPTGMTKEISSLEADIKKRLSALDATLGNEPRQSTRQSAHPTETDEETNDSEILPPPTTPTIVTTDTRHLKDALQNKPQIDYTLFDRVKNLITPLTTSLKPLQEQVSATKQHLGEKVDTSEWHNKTTQTRKQIESQVQKIRFMRKSYWFLGLAAATVVFLIMMILWTIQGQQKQQDISKLITSAEKSQQQASEALQQQDIPNARKYLSTALATSEKAITLDTSNKKAIDLRSAINERLDKIDGIVRIKEIPILVDLQKVDKTIQKPTDILRIEQVLYIVDTKANKLFSYNTTTNKAQALLSSLAQAKNLIGGDIFENLIYLYSKTDGLQEFNTQTEQLRASTVSLGGSWEPADKIAVYNNTIYLLDIAHDQIWRHRPLSDAFAPSTRYFDTTDVSLAGTVDFAIDGDVYLLKGNGQLFRYTQVRKPDTSFSVTGINPPLDKPTSIYMGTGQQDSLFIGDPTQKRIVEINKNGQFQRQYILEDASIKNIQDISVDTSKKQLFFLNEAKVYRIPLQ